MLGEERLDVVEILTPGVERLPILGQVLASRPRVVSLPAPLAASLQACDEMIAACRDAGVKLHVYENALFYPLYREARRLLDGGIVGEILSLRLKQFLAGSQPGGESPASTLANLVPDQGVHAFALVSWLTGESIRTIYSWNAPNTPLYVMWKFARSKKQRIQQHYGTMEVTTSPRMALPSPLPDSSSNSRPASDQFVEVSGSHGVVWINQGRAGGTEISRHPALDPIIVYREGEVEVRGGQLRREWVQSYSECTNHLLECALHADLRPVLSGGDARRALQVALACRASSTTGEEIIVDEVTD